MRHLPLALLLVISTACGDDPVGALDAGSRDAAPADRGVSGPDLGPTDLPSPDRGFEDATLADTLDFFDLGPLDADPADGGEEDLGPSCVPDEVCVTNPGAPCLTGRVSCDSGAAVCVDDQAAADGLSCTNGLCVAGLCAPPVVINQDVILTSDAVTAGRSCAEAPQYSVVGLTDLEATLTATPTADCLAPGDEVLLINLQGAPGATDNVGVWERLEVAQISPFTVSFVTPKTRFYGEASNNDDGLGTQAGEQRVALIRIPRFGQLTVGAGATLTATRWDGVIGGVLAFRAAALDVEGAVSGSGLGYRPGQWSRDSFDCDDNLTTGAGESIGGLGPTQIERNIGGAGGIGAQSNLSFNGNTPVSPSAGHALPGEPGLNANGRTLGEPGEAYGIGDGTRLTMGSGSGGNLTCDVGNPEPILITIGPRAGGIVLLFSEDITVEPTGSISADAPNTFRDVSASGGYVLLEVGRAELGDARVSALGGIGQSVNVSGPVLMNAASPGYVVIRHSGVVTGTTTPGATLMPR